MRCSLEAEQMLENLSAFIQRATLTTTRARVRGILQF